MSAIQKLHSYTYVLFYLIILKVGIIIIFFII